MQTIRQSMTETFQLLLEGESEQMTEGKAGVWPVVMWAYLKAALVKQSQHISRI